MCGTRNQPNQNKKKQAETRYFLFFHICKSTCADRQTTQQHLLNAEKFTDEKKTASQQGKVSCVHQTKEYPLL